MIFDKIENAHLYYGLSKEIEMGLKFLINTDLNSLEVGKHMIDEDRLFILVQEYEPKNLAESKFESHNKHIDIQYICKGKELMAYSPLGNLEATTEYDDKKDITFYNGTGSFSLADAGSFLIFFPTDGHMPSVAAEDRIVVRKIVIKIQV